MKYFYAIAFIICTITVITVVALWPEPPPQDSSVAVTINGHPLYKNALEKIQSGSGYHNENHQSLLDSAITRELLIQEAQRLRIDKEESFRNSLQSFYEQSLIKILLDRKFSQIDIHVNDSEIEKFASLFGKKVTFTRLPVSATPPYNLADENGEQTEILFDDLAESLQVSLAGLSPGEFSIKFDTGSDRYAIRLDKVAEGPELHSPPPEHEYLKAILEDYHRQQQINNWLDTLRQSASITIHNG